jgi:hypothetical protein
MTDMFKKYSRGLTSPPEHAIAISPDDTSELSQPTRALYVGGGGNLRVTLLGGSTVSFANVPAGSMIPLRVTRVFATNTTASDILGLW